MPETLRTLTGKTVIVTGAGRGIGRGVATELAARGADVVVVDRDPDAVRGAAEALAGAGGSVEPVVADLLDDDAAEAIVGATVARFGAIDALVNNAMASVGQVPFVDQTDADFDLAVGVGPRATFRLMKAVHPHLVARGGGSIVNFGSGAGTMGMPGFATYALAKEAVRGLTKVAAVEWGADRIRVNTLCPAALTEGMASWFEAQPEAAEAMAQTVPLKRIGDPRTDIGPAVAYLVGDDSTYVTGQTINVDGGSGTYR